jgi:hypothetical protein
MVFGDELEGESEVVVLVGRFVLVRVGGDVMDVDVEREAVQLRDRGDGLRWDACFFVEFAEGGGGEVGVVGFGVAAWGEGFVQGFVVDVQDVVVVVDDDGAAGDVAGVGLAAGRGFRSGECLQQWGEGVLFVGVGRAR